MADFTWNAHADGQVGLLEWLGKERKNEVEIMFRVPRKIANLVLIGVLGVAIPAALASIVKPTVLRNVTQAFSSNQTQWIDLLAEPLSFTIGGLSILSAFLIVGFFLYLVSDILTFVSIGALNEKMRENASWFSSFASNHFKTHSALMNVIREYENSGPWYKSLPEIFRGYKALGNIETNLIAFLVVNSGNSLPEELSERRTHRRLGFCIATSIGIAIFWLSWPTDSALYGPLITGILAPVAILFFAMRTAGRYYTMLFSFVHEQAENEISFQEPPTTET